VWGRLFANCLQSHPFPAGATLCEEPPTQLSDRRSPQRRHGLRADRACPHTRLTPRTASCSRPYVGRFGCRVVQSRETSPGLVPRRRQPRTAVEGSSSSAGDEENGCAPLCGPAISCVESWHQEKPKPSRGLRLRDARNDPVELRRIVAGTPSVWRLRPGRSTSPLGLVFPRGGVELDRPPRQRPGSADPPDGFAV